MAANVFISPPSERLRQACEAAHAATEQVPLLAKLATGDLSDADYARVMASLAILFEAIVGGIQALPGGAELLALTDLPARARQARTDVCSLDAGDRPGALGVAFIQGSGSALGAIYALEGARLGGALIGARLRRAGRPVGTAGYSFFDLGAVPVAEAWRDFKSQLDRLLATEAELAEAVLGARGVFDLTATVFGDSSTCGAAKWGVE
jgi:heme oxygenase